MSRRIEKAVGKRVWTHENLSVPGVKPRKGKFSDPVSRRRT